ncbi:MAG: SEC-C domain-containing protein [Desulfovibrio sp.]|nr:SEC-C domain-containing protein [Desulfovibrio sp.]
MPMFDPDAPCYCGSGKKYKNCCMEREMANFRDMLKEAGMEDMTPEDLMDQLETFMKNPQAMEAMGERMLPLKTAGDLLARRWGEQELLAAFYGGKGWDENSFRQASMQDKSQMDLAFCEWVLSQAKPGEPSAALAGAPKDIMPPLSPRAYDFVEELPGSSLSLYEIQDKRRGEVLLLDLLSPKAEPVWAAMRDGEIGFFRWDIAGLRLLGEPGSLHLSPTPCCLPRIGALKIADAVKAKLRGNARRKQPEDPARVQALTIIHGWLDFLKAGEYEAFPLPDIPPKPKSTDLESKGALGEVDWGRTEAVLDQASDFVREDAGWVWSVEATPGRRAATGRIENRKGALAAAAPNVYLLRALRSRLETLGINPAPLSLERVREVDSVNWHPAALPRPATREEWGYAWLVREYLGLLYTRIDVLNGKSAKELLSARNGRERAAEFLKLVENAEAQRQDDPVVPEPLDLGFLWRELGLEDMFPAACAQAQEQKPARARIIPFKPAQPR